MHSHKTALVFLDIFFFKSFKSTFKVSTFTSTNLGFKPDCIIGHNEVDQQRAGIKHSSFFFNLV